MVCVTINIIMIHGRARYTRVDRSGRYQKSKPGWRVTNSSPELAAVERVRMEFSVRSRVVWYCICKEEVGRYGHQ
jgi:hypothetical protein